MEVISLIIESMTPEQYKKFYQNLPLSSITVNNNKDGYIDSLTSGVYQKQLLNIMISNYFNISHVTDNSISFLIDLSNGQIIKYLREHGVHLGVDALSIDILNVEINFNNERDIQILNQLLENYYLANKSSFNPKTNDYIMKLYQNAPEEYLNYINEMNKNEIAILKEKHIQESSLPFNNISDIQTINKNEISIKEIYNNDPVFNKIPFDKLTQDQKQVMCNKYFRKVLQEKLFDFNFKLKEMFGIIYTIKYFIQYEQNKGNYGMSGNTPPFDENNNYKIEVNMYPDINYFSMNGDMVKLNEDLLGQIMITTLHEHEHILQRLGIVDERLMDAITNFSSINPDGSDDYFNNYNKDPAEIDANLMSFNRFVELSKYYGIENPEEIIMKKVNNVIKNAEENMNFYGDNMFNNYNEIQAYLYQRLQKSINNYCSEDQHNKAL